MSRQKPIVSGGLKVLLKRGFKVNGLFTTKNLERYVRTQVYQENDFAQLGLKLILLWQPSSTICKVIFGPFDDVTKTKSLLLANYAKVSEAVAALAALPGVFAPFGIRTPKTWKCFSSMVKFATHYRRT